MRMLWECFRMQASDPRWINAWDRLLTLLQVGERDELQFKEVVTGSISLAILSWHSAGSPEFFMAAYSAMILCQSAWVGKRQWTELLMRQNKSFFPLIWAGVWS